MYLYILNSAQRAEALAFNNDPSGPYYDVNHAHLPDGYGVQPIPIAAPAPYTYAGKWILPLGLASSTDYIVMWDFLTTLTIVDIDPAEAFPPSDDV